MKEDEKKEDSKNLRLQFKQHQQEEMQKFKLHTIEQERINISNRIEYIKSPLLITNNSNNSNNHIDIDVD
jgi:hypothetical protein